MRRKAPYYQSAPFAAPKSLALAATVTLIFSAPMVHAATLTTGADPTAVPIGQTNATVMGNTVSIPFPEQFTDVIFTVSASAPFITGGIVDVMATGSDGASASNSFTANNTSNPFAPVTTSQDFTFTGATDLTSVSISTTTSSIIGGNVPTVTGINFSGISGLSEIPLPASFPLFASGLGALGLLARRRKRKSTTSVLA